MDNVLSMDMVSFEKHLSALIRIEAMEMLRDMKVQEYPQLKDNARAELFNKVSKKATPPSQRKVHTFDELEKLF